MEGQRGQRLSIALHIKGIYDYDSTNITLWRNGNFTLAEVTALFQILS